MNLIFVLTKRFDTSCRFHHHQVHSYAWFVAFIDVVVLFSATKQRNLYGTCPRDIKPTMTTTSKHLLAYTSSLDLSNVVAFNNTDFTTK